LKNNLPTKLNDSTVNVYQVCTSQSLSTCQLFHLSDR